MYSAKRDTGGHVLCTLLALTICWVSGRPLTPDTTNFHSHLLTRVSRRLMKVPDLRNFTEPDRLFLVDKTTIVDLTPRSTKLNKASMKAMRKIWAYNMTSPLYRRTINPHEINMSLPMSSKEHADLQFMRWREVFLMKPQELKYYINLRKKFNVFNKRKCIACREIVLDTYEQYNFHSFEYDHRGYVKPVTPPPDPYPNECYICPTKFETSDELARHYVTHSVNFGKYPTFTYPYWERETVARQRTSIVNFGSDTVYFNVWPGEDQQYGA